MFTLLAVLTTFLYGTLIGWLVHWSIHQKWAGFAHKAHMTHHLKLYPPGDLVSETYRDAGKDNSTLFFTPLVFLGLIALGVGLRALGASVLLLAGLVLEGIIVGVAHDYMHTLFHLSGTRLLKFGWFQKLRTMHFYHHRRMNRNFGIFYFGWDALFRTLRKT